MDPDEIFRLKQQLEEEKKKREEVEAALVAEKERADRYKASLTATTLARYLELGQIYVIPNLNVKGDSKGTSTTLTKVDGKLYPPRLEYWNDFEHLCDQICGSLIKVLSDRQLFSPEVSIIEDGNKLKELEVWNEQDVRSYVEAAIESPAQRVINEYLREIGDSNRVRFQSSGNSLSHMDSHCSAGDQAASATEWSSSNGRNGRGVPDRWGIAYRRTEGVGRYLSENIRQRIDCLQERLPKCSTRRRRTYFCGSSRANNGSGSAQRSTRRPWQKFSVWPMIIWSEVASSMGMFHPGTP
ncbi:hypothetical protein VTN31DRAFT_4169 [Thermomyces dupontii]|uniref:uncharacterized protein n=1 Tax=Talaromyces thermophilus TaxID=28565 RepID=UPI003743B6C8